MEGIPREIAPPSPPLPSFGKGKAPLLSSFYRQLASLHPSSPPPPGKWTLDFPFIFRREGEEGEGSASLPSKEAALLNLSNILLATSPFTRSN